MSRPKDRKEIYARLLAWAEEVMDRPEPPTLYVVGPDDPLFREYRRLVEESKDESE